MEPTEIFAKIWPDGMPPGEHAEWSTVPKSRRDSVVQRLKALAALEAGEVNVGNAAALAGLSRQAFHKLRMRWESERSIRSLTPYRFREQAQVERKRAEIVDRADSGSTDLFSAAALRLVTSRPSETNGTLGRRLRDDLDQRISQPTAVELVRQARRAVALDPDLLKETYGRSLLIDFIGLRIEGVFVADEPAPVAAIVLERASGIILGFAVGERGRMRDLQMDAIHKSIEFLSQHRVDIPASHAIGCRMILPEAEWGEDAGSITEGLVALLGADRVYAVGMRRFGVRTTSILGHKLGRLRLSSRIGEGETGKSFHPRKKLSKSPTLTLAEFSVLARSEVERHNEPLLVRIQALPAPTILSEKGGIARTLEKIFAALKPL